MARDDISDYTDPCREAVEELLAAKAEYREPGPVEETTEPAGTVVDLMTALNASVEKARADRDQDAEVHDLPKKRTAKTAPAKKTTAKKTTGRKTAAKKTAADRKPRSA